MNPLYDPPSAAGTPYAYAEVLDHNANTQAGQQGTFCKLCHSIVGSRYTPYHNYVKSGVDYTPAVGTQPLSHAVSARRDQGCAPLCP